MKFVRYDGDDELVAPQDLSVLGEFSESTRIVWQILYDQPATRDSDKLLLLAYWQFECGAANIDHSTTPWGRFKQLLMSAEVYQPATIIRCRAKIQEAGYMRGKSRMKRLERAEAISDYMVKDKREMEDQDYQ